jgi:hypothetical protein
MSPPNPSVPQTTQVGTFGENDHVNILVQLAIDITNANRCSGIGHSTLFFPFSYYFLGWEASECSISCCQTVHRDSTYIHVPALMSRTLLLRVPKSKRYRSSYLVRRIIRNNWVSIVANGCNTKFINSYIPGTNQISQLRDYYFHFCLKKNHDKIC